MTIRVAIVEDQRIVREILEAQLAREEDIELVGSTGTGREAIDMAAAVRPDMLLVDIGLPDMSGEEVVKAVRNRHPQIKLIVLSVHSDADTVRRMLRAGAEGYVAKSAALLELLEAIRNVMRNTIYLSSGLAELRLAPALRAGAVQLARREREVLALIAEGLRAPEIAARLGISVATVETHRRNIMRKLDLHSVALLTKFALCAGLTHL